MLEPGSELDGGKYKVVRLLGQGGMGAVFEAEHRDTLRRVAIKCLHPLLADDPAVTERLVREARATARIRHPNVVDVYDVGRDGAMIFLVMEYLDGEPLSTVFARRDYAPHEIITILIDAMRGVAAAHQCGVIHRDIKPDNIILAKVANHARPVPKVLDFGISKLDKRISEQRTLTRSGMAIGTPSYMSYEQLSAEGEIDGRADVYAFGVMLYEALTGQAPFEADTFSELLIRISTQPLVPPDQLCPQLPSSLSRVVMWALERDRAQRISSMELLIRELEPFAQRRSYDAEMSEPPRPPTSRPTPPAAKPAAPAPDTRNAVEALPSRRRSPLQSLSVWLLTLLLLATVAGLALMRERALTVHELRPVSPPTPMPVAEPPAAIAPVVDNTEPSDNMHAVEAAPPNPEPERAPHTDATLRRVEPERPPRDLHPRPPAPKPRDFGFY